MLNWLDTCVCVMYLVCLFKNLPKWEYRFAVTLLLWLSVDFILLLVRGVCTPLLFIAYVALIAVWIYLVRAAKKKIN